LLKGLAICVYLISLAIQAEQTKITEAIVTIVTDTGLGSGVIIDSSGLVVTNQHVIEDVDAVAIVLANGDIFQGVELISIDEMRDLAILRFGAFDLTAAILGNSNSVSVGDRVRAVGSPTGLRGTVTEGIISAIRSVEGTRLLQIDAAISSGSSGGGVFDQDNKLVGITVGTKREAQNINFAIPINYVRALKQSDTSIKSFENFSSTSEVMGRIQGNELSTKKLNSISTFEKAVAFLSELLGEPSERYESSVLFKREEGGNILAQEIGDEDDDWNFLIISIRYSLDGGTVSDSLYEELLKLNFKNNMVKVGLDESGDLWLAYENLFVYLERKELALALVSLISLDETVLEVALGRTTTSTTRKTRSDFGRYKKKRKDKLIKVLEGKARFYLGDAWQLVKEEPIEDGTITDYRNGARYIRIIEEPNFINFPIESTSELIELSVNSDDRVDQAILLAEGTRKVDKKEIYWAVYETSSKDGTFLYEYNVYPSENGFLQALVWGLNLDGTELEKLGDEIIQTLRVR